MEQSSTLGINGMNYYALGEEMGKDPEQLSDWCTVSREAHVRFCEGLRVKLPRSTHPYIPTAEGWLYLAGVKDVFTCEIVGYVMADRMTQELTGQALFRAVQRKRPMPGLIHHSDRGSQYCAADYRKLVDQFGMKASMSRRGNCYDNAPIESF